MAVIPLFVFALTRLLVSTSSCNLAILFSSSRILPCNASLIADKWLTLEGESLQKIILTCFDIIPTLFENYSKCRIFWHFFILLTCNTVWLQATQNVAFKILAFFIKYMLNETFSVIFEHCATSYLIPESWLIISFRLKNRLHLAVFYTHQSYQNKHLVTVLNSYDSCILTVLCPHLKIHCNFPLDWTS